ncbi:MAG: WD40 repeat domain-containing protein [Crocinitomicaceae bacterium]|nr:WD40 repeat domain-containing protein [Crocinitomicaceae bacterium]
MLFKKQKEIIGHAGAIYTCAYKDGFIYTGSGDNYVARWNAETGEQDKFAIKFEESVYSLVFLDENRLVVGLANGHVHVFDLNSNEEIKFFTQHTKAVFELSFNEKKQQLYIADADGNLSIWDSRTLELLVYLPLDCGKVRDISVSQTGENFVLACQDDTLRVFESNFFNEILTIDAHKNGATTVLYHPNNENHLISGGKDAMLRLWDLRTSKCLEEIPAHNFAIYSIQAINDGKTIITSSRDKTIKVWSDGLKFQERLDLKVGGHKHSVNKIRPVNTNQFVSVSDDKKIIIWEEA